MAKPGGQMVAVAAFKTALFNVVIGMMCFIEF
jgi:hypothetical protein